MPVINSKLRYHRERWWTVSKIGSIRRLKNSATMALLVADSRTAWARAGTGHEVDEMRVGLAFGQPNRWSK